MTISANPSNYFKPNLTISKSKALLYYLAEVHDFNSISGNISGYIAKNFDYRWTLTYKHYGFEKVAQPDSLGQSYSILDNRYVISNLRLGYTPNPKTHISCGTSLDTYERGYAKVRGSFFANVSYEVQPASFIYMGISKRQTKYNDIELGAPFQGFKHNSATAYVKLAVTI